MMQRSVRGQSQRIRRIIRPGDFTQMKQSAKHILNLPLIRPAVPGDAGLHFQRCRLQKGDRMFLERQENHAPRMGDIQRGFLVGREEEFLHDGEFRRGLLEEAREIAMDLHQTFRERQSGSRLNREPVDHAEFVRRNDIKNTDANSCYARVDAKDSHAEEGLGLGLGLGDENNGSPNPSPSPSPSFSPHSPPPAPIEK